MPLWQAGLLATGLVLALGGAYVVGLWPFTGKNGTGQEPMNLKRFDPVWRDPTVELEQGDGSDPSTEETGAGARGLQEDAATHSPASQGAGDGVGSAEVAADEYRILAASDILGPGEHEQEMKSRIEEQRSKLAKKLASEFGAVAVDVSFLRDRGGVLLLVGRASRKDDAGLKRLLDRVRGAGGFDDATIKKFKTSARGKRDG